MTNTNLAGNVQGPTAKEKKYDRQLRLWGSEGQQALENAHILLINGGAGAVGAETLKNLVLPGVGEFTIYENSNTKVTPADLGVNFFLDSESLGQPRAKAVCEFLSELNPDVKGNWISEDLDSFLAKGFAKYTLVLLILPTHGLEKIVTEYNRSSLSNTTLITISSIGFYSAFKIYYPKAFMVLDSHPDPATISDLRLTAPWPELIEHFKEKTKDFETLNDHDHGHVPWLLLVMFYLEEWKISHGGKYPTKYDDKKAFREYILEKQRVSSSAGPEENYEQAAASIYKSLSDSTPPSAVREIWDAPEVDKLDTTNPDIDFWVLVKALKEFAVIESVLPLSGSLPDMKAQSSDYIALQRIYKDKARSDALKIIHSVRQIESKLGRSNPIPDARIEAFCKNSAHMRLIRGNNGDDQVQIDQPTEPLMIFRDAVVLHWAFKAVNTFLINEHRIPGGNQLDEEDSGTLSKLIRKLAQRDIEASGAEDKLVSFEEDIDKISRELVRSAGGELHNISSLVGGMVSQEAIKVITKQYTPIDNECIFDGIKSTAAVIRMS